MIDGNSPMLFNVASDLGERNDVSQQHLDIVQKLFPLIGKWEQDVDAEAKQLAGGTTSQQ